MLVENRQFEHIPTFIWRRDAVGISPKFLASENYGVPIGYRAWSNV